MCRTHANGRTGKEPARFGRVIKQNLALVAFGRATVAEVPSGTGMSETGTSRSDPTPPQALKISGQSTSL